MPNHLTDPELWKLLSIPVVAGIVGWVTNWLAIKMTFQPLEFLGIRPFFGWQGIIPSKAQKMAETFVDSTMHRLGTFPELFEQMEPQRIAQHVTDYLEPRLDDYTDDVLHSGHAVLWENLPAAMRQSVYEAVRRELPRLVGQLLAEIGQRVEEVIDFKAMIVDRLTTDKQLLNRLFLESGAAEFRFLINSGFHFGVLFGLVQLGVWVAHPAWWVLPLFGLLVGWATNWIAINLIFRPLHPRRVGPFTVHGLFLRRQPEVAGVWCRLVTREIVTLRRIMAAMLSGPRSERTHALIRRHVKPIVDQSAGLALPLAQAAIGPVGFARMKEAVGAKAIEISADPFEDRAFDEERSAVVEQILRERMVGLPSEEFQDLLRPCFQEDEWKLILLGAVLGLLAGTAQLVFVFGVP